MAYASRRYIKHIDDYDRVHRLEIQQKDYTGGESSIDGNKGRGAFKFEHEDVTDEDSYLKVYANPIQKGMLEVYPLIKNSTDYALLTDIFQSDEDEFRLVWKIDGSIFWTGYVLNDLLEFEESSYPYTSTIVAKDFSRLKGMDYALNDTRQTWITTIADLLSNLDLGLDIETATSWTESHLDSSLTGDYDYLNHIRHETKALREFGRTGDEEPQPISVYQALERVLSDNCLILKQIGGKYVIDQLSAYDDPANVLVSTYDSTGTQTAQTTVDKTLAYNRNIMRVKSNGSKSKGFVAIKRAKVKFEHRNKISGILFPEETEFTDSESKQFEEPFISDGTQTFRLTGLVRALMRTGATDASASLDIRIVRSGQADYYLDETGDNWITTGTGFADLELVDMGGDVWQSGFDILTPETPADADGILRITISSATASNTMPAVAHTTFWRDMALEIRNINNSTYSNFQLTQADGYSEKYEHAKTWYGDGPNSFSVSALRYSSADGDITTESWQRRGTTTGYRYYHENVLKEIVDIQRTFVFRKEAAMWGLYDATKVLQYRSGNYYYTGGSFAGATGDWNVRIMDVNVQTGSDTFEEILKYADEGVESSTPSSPPSEGVGGVSDHGELGGLGDPSDHPWAAQTDLSNLSSITTAQDNLGLTDGNADLDLNSLAITGTKNQLDLVRESDQMQGLRVGGGAGIADYDSYNESSSVYGRHYFQATNDTETVNVLDLDYNINEARLYTDFRIDTGKFLAPADYTFRNAGDTAFRNVEVAGLTATTGTFAGDVSIMGTVGQQIDLIRDANTNQGLKIGGGAGAAQYDSYVTDGATYGRHQFYSQNNVESHLSFEIDKNLESVFIYDSLSVETDHFSDWFSANPTGWQATYAGVGDFRTLYIDELIAKAFTVDVAQALAGSDILTKSVGILDQNFTIPAVSSTGTMVIEDLAGLADFQAFEAGDWIRLRIVDRTSGLTIGDVYGTVSGYTDNADGTQSWTFTTDYAGPSSALVGQVANKGAVVLDYGVSGDAFIERTVLDRSSSTDFSKTPYDRIVRWTNSGSGGPRPSATGYSAEVLSQSGNINGLGPFTTETYGFYAKDNFYVDLDNGGMNFGKDAGGAGVDGIHLGANDYWYTDKTGSVGGGILNWTGSTVNAAGFTADSTDLFSSDGAGEIRLWGRAGLVGMRIAPDTSNLDNRMDLLYNSSTGAWGIRGVVGGSDFFRFGDTNRIAGSYFDADAIWGGSSSKSSADWRISASEGIELARGLVGKGGTSIGKSLAWEFSMGSDDKAAYITTYANDSTPTLNDMNLWIAAGYDDSAQQGVGSIQLDAGTIRLTAGDDIIINPLNNLDLTAANVNIPDSLEVGTELRIPVYSDATRPSNPPPGAIIFNTDGNTVQVGNNSGGWKPL